MDDILIVYFTFLFVGSAVGLLPFFVGRATNKPVLGRLGLIITVASGLIMMQFASAIAFTIVILARRTDCGGAAPVAPAPAAPPVAPPKGGTLGITCLSGPMKGRTYSIDLTGLMIGREGDCAICFGAETAGISRHHCSLTWGNGGLYLTDLGSTYGTYMADGRRLAAQSPVPVSAGTRFYLGSNHNLFQIIILV